MKRLCLILVLCLLLTGSVSAELAARPGKFVVVLLDQLSLEEIAEYGGDALVHLFHQGAEALLNVRTDKGIESAYTYTAFGAGNRGEKYGAIPGLLGQILQDHNYSIALFGNSDYGLEEHREVVTIAGDNNGYLFFSDTSDDLLIADPTFPGGLRTYYSKMQSAFVGTYPKNDVIFLEIGDIARIKTGLLRREITREQANSLVKATLARFDYLLEEVMETLDEEQDRLMIVSPTPDPLRAEQGAKLSWVLLTGYGVDKGVLTTGTTRRIGLGTITDLAPTILEHFAIATPSVMNGRPLVVADAVGGLKKMITFNRQIFRTSEWRPWYIKGFILIQIIVISLATLSFFVRSRIPRKMWRLIRVLLLSIMLVPGFFLLLSPYIIPSFGWYLLVLLGVVAVVAWLIDIGSTDRLSPIALIVTVTCLLLLVDTFRGSPWIARSVLGYCPVIGARFYGIGNEFMGILVGGTLISWTALLDSSAWLKNRKLLFTPLVFGMVMLVIGFPKLGANFGGILTAMAAFTLTFVLMFEKRRRKQMVVFAGSILFAILGIIVLADTYGWTGEQSHFGRTIILIKDQGVAAVTNILWRKLSMNLKLLRWTIWTRVLLTFIIVLALLFKRPRGAMYELVNQYPHLSLGFLGVLLGSVVTMVVNDSGVVAAATLLFFAVFPLLYLVLVKVSTQTEAQKNS